MSTFQLKITIVALLCCAAVTGARPAKSPTAPLRASELLSLVAGDALPENLVREIGTYGLAFRPDESYRGLLKKAGADSRILTAVASAKIVVEQGPTVASGKELLLHLATAASLTNDKHYDEAVRELTAALSVDAKSPECAFVMGQVALKEQLWDRAAAIYDEVLREAPDFRETHTKLSLALYRMGDFDRALTEARVVLKEDPDDAEAHKNAGLALMGMQKYDAAQAEYQEALRLKPDYESVHMDLAILFDARGDFENAIVEYRKAIYLGPGDPDALYNLGVTYDHKGNFESAVQAYREVKRLEPRRYDARQNLGATLMNLGRTGEAVVEFRELVKLYPDEEMCVYSLALGLFRMNNFAEAAPEFRKAAELDPSDPKPHVNLGAILEEQKHDDEALREYAVALKLDDNTANAHKAIGRILLRKKHVPQALKELRAATDLNPADASIHDLYGKALQASGNTKDAIGEFRQAISLDPKQIQIILELAAALESQGDWARALDEYRHAALADASIELEGKIKRSDDRDPQREYKDAQKRLDAHIAALKSAGKTTQAAQLEASIHVKQSADGLSQKVDAAIQAGTEADKQGHFIEGAQRYEEAVRFAEKLQPHDPRLMTSLDGLGNHYLGQNPAAAQRAFERELQVAQEIFGPQSPQMTGALQSLARNAMIQHDYATAEKFFFRAVDLNEKVFGEGSDKVAEALVRATSLYFVKEDYPKAEPYLLRAVRIDEALYGADNVDMLVPRGTLCALYDRWEQPSKSVACDQVLLTVLEKQYGPKSPLLVTTLASEAKGLRTLGRSQEADKVEERVALIRAATMASN